MEKRDELEEDTTTSVEVEPDLISRPELTLNSSIDENIISLHHSFGYDCKKMYNLVLIDKETLVFASGNLLHFFNVTTSSMTTRRSACGGGIGAIVKNPNPDYGYLTVAENGRKPTIFIYKFPEMEMIAMLKKGTKRQFSILDYTSDGELLASQGGDPDYMLTIWDWKRKEIKLRAKSFSNDVINLMFSPYIPEQLITCGLGHIKFWKMSSTFTGLKLQGLIGRFGKTEICDIYGICSMPDGKIISSCEWGNILVWDDGLIKLEVCRKNRRPCHTGPITQIFMRNADEIVTVGTDGLICIWFWETVDLADPPEDDRFVEIEPSHEFRVGSLNYNAELLKIIKIDSEDADWYAQDGFGGIWWCDLSTEIRPQPAKQLFRCHSGEIVALETSPVSTQIATLGNDGRLYIYDYVEKKLIFHHQFLAAGGDFIWIPVSLDPTGAVMIIGLADGVVRVITFDHKAPVNEQLQLVQAVKCHCKPIRKVSINPRKTIFVSASEDSTIFIHQLVKGEPLISIQPIGFIKVPSPVTCIHWNPLKWSTVIAGCKLGDVIQSDLPEQPNASTETSYFLGQVPVSQFKFKSIKSQIRRNERIKQIEMRKDQKRQRKLRQLEKMKSENYDLDIDEESFLADSDGDEVLEAIFVPDPPSPVLWIQFTSDETLSLSMGGYDAGYIYEYTDDGELLSFTPVSDADDIEIHSYVYLDEYLILGMSDGKIRINRIRDNWRDWSDYWLLSMHDNFFGKIPAIKFSYDELFMFTVGGDGNLFSYNWNTPRPKITAIEAKPVPRLTKKVYDIDDLSYLSLEQQKEKENDERRQKISTDNKNKVLRMIEELRKEFNEIMETNSMMPNSQKLTSANLELDTRISEDLQQQLDIQMDVVRRKKEFDYERVKLAGKKLMSHFIDPIDFPIQVIGVKSSKSVFSFRIKKLGLEFTHLHDEMERKIQEAARKKRVDIIDASIRTVETESTTPAVESFLIGLSPSDIDTKLESKMRRLLNKYRERKSKEVARKKEWQTVNAEKPNPEMDHPTDKKQIEEAQQTIGNYKLKTDPMFEASEEERETIAKKLQELLKTREDVYNIRNDYNQKVMDLREKKRKLYDFIKRKLEKLDEIHLEIPEKQRMKPEVAVNFDFDAEFPERNLDLRKYLMPENYNMSLISVGSSKLGHKTPAEKLLMDAQRKVLHYKPVKASAIPRSADVSMRQFQQIINADMKPSEWEEGLINLRTKRRLFEQQQIIEKIDLRIKTFDEEIEKVSAERFEVEVKSKFKELYLLTLNHELMILKDFESIEESLEELVDNKDSEMKQLEGRISETNTEIGNAQRIIEELLETKSIVEQKFNANCNDNKFSPFFRRIFKKKLQSEDREDKGDEEMEKEMSESVSSSSNDDSLEGSVSNLKVGMKYLSEDECPKGCDRKIYDLTFELRQERHKLEAAILEKTKEIETFQFDIETMTERLEQTNVDYDTSKAQLTELRHKKQKMMNEVHTVVCLKMDQMQYFKNQSEFVDIDNTLLFNNHNVTKLYSRVGKLALETIEAKRKHRINVIHLAKMKTDCKFMEKQISDLKDGTNHAMLKKFGRVIDLNEVEETILRRFAFEMQVEMRANAEDIKRQYFNKINELKKTKIVKEETLNRVIQEATEKLNILTVLEEEKNFLHRIMTMQSRKKELKQAGLPFRDVENDLCKLKEISNHQKEQIEMLQREIRALSLKSKPFVDTRQDFESLNYSILQLRGEGRFEDSICSNPDESILSSTRATTPDNGVYNEIYGTVKRFAEDNLCDQLEDVEIENVTLNLSKYLASISANFPLNDLDEILPEVITNLKSFLPKHTRLAPEKIAELVGKVMGHCSEVNDVNKCEVLKEIISNTIEAANQAAITSRSYLQVILSEIFKQMVITMRFGDIASSDCTAEIIQRLSKLNSIQPKNVNLDEVVEEIAEYANENMEDDIDKPILKRILANILAKLSV